MRHATIAISVLAWACRSGEAPVPDAPATTPGATPEIAAEPIETEVQWPRDRSVSDVTTRAAHRTAIARLLGRADELPTELAPRGSDTLGRFVPLATGDGKKPLANFHTALDRLRAGGDPAQKVRIAVFGASGTAAERWTGYLRAYLQTRFGVGGPGFVPLVKHTKWTRHNDYTVGSSKHWIRHSAGKHASSGDYYGLSGVAMAALRTGETAKISAEAGSPAAADASMFELWYLRQPGGGSLQIEVDGRPRAKLDTAFDRTDTGYERIDVEPGAHAFSVKTLDGNEVRIFGAVAETSHAGIVLDAMGIVGAHASVILRGDLALWTQQLRRRSPALVVLAFGTNEAHDETFDATQFGREYDAVLTRLHQAVPEASCVLLSPGDHAEPDDAFARANLTLARQIVGEVAQSHGCAWWDALEFMGGEKSMARWVAADPPLAKADHVHTTTRGAALVGMAVADALLWDYDAERISPPASP